MVQIGIISDIHGMDSLLNEAVLRLKNCSRIINLGDVVSYGGNTKNVIKTLNHPRIINIMGNHDLEALVSREQHDIMKIMKDDREFGNDYGLDDDEKKFLKSFVLSKTLILNNRRHAFTHGYMPNYNIYEMQNVNKNNARELIIQTKADYNFVGGSHASSIILLTESSKNETLINSNCKIKLKQDMQYVINIGSLGTLNNSGIVLNYAILDSMHNELSFFYERSMGLNRNKIMPLTHLKYPVKGKEEWNLVELVGIEGGNLSSNAGGYIFSKLYKGFLVDVIVLRKGPSFEVTSKIKGNDGDIKYKKVELFKGSNAHRDSLEFAATKECPNLEYFIDISLCLPLY